MFVQGGHVEDVHLDAAERGRGTQGRRREGTHGRRKTDRPSFLAHHEQGCQRPSAGVTTRSPTKHH